MVLQRLSSCPQYRIRSTCVSRLQLTVTIPTVKGSVPGKQVEAPPILGWITAHEAHVVLKLGDLFSSDVDST